MAVTFGIGAAAGYTEPGLSADGVHNLQMGDTTNSGMQDDTTTIRGRLFVGGHEPFTVLAIEKEDNTAIVLSGADSLYQELWSHQNKTLECRGIFKPDPLHGETFHVIAFQKIK